MEKVKARAQANGPDSRLLQAAERTWRKLDGTELLMEVLRGTKFKDGILEEAA